MWARSGNPPSEPNSSSSIRSSSDWKARDEEMNRDRSNNSSHLIFIVCFILLLLVPPEERANNIEDWEYVLFVSFAPLGLGRGPSTFTMWAGVVWRSFFRNNNIMENY